MNKFFILFLSLAIVSTAAAQTTKPAGMHKNEAPVVMRNLIDSFSYAAGYNIALNMKEQGISGLNTALLQSALNDVFQDKPPSLNQEQVNSVLQKKLKEFAEKKEAALKVSGIEFLEANKKRPGVVVLPSGIQYEVLVPGNLKSIKPKAIDTVVVNYAGTLINGTEFDNSFKRGQPTTYPANGFIKGWTEVLQLMNIGSKWKVYIPNELAYGMNPRDPKLIPPGSALIFEISLEGVKPTIQTAAAHGPGDGHDH